MGVPPVKTWRGAPRIPTVLVLLWMNFFGCFLVSQTLGGDALGVIPSQQGYVLRSHGQYQIASEGEWLFSLLYTGLTFVGTPIAVVVVLFTRQFVRELSLRAKTLLLLSLCPFLGTWLVLTLRALIRSIADVL